MEAQARVEEASPDFHAVYRGEVDYVWCSLKRLGAPSRELEDLTHDVFLTAFRRFSDYDASRPIRPWLFGIAFRVLVAYRRKRSSAEVVAESFDQADERSGPEAKAMQSEARELLLEAMQSLDEDKRAVFIMKDIDGHSMPEIADVLGIKLNTAYSRLRLARRAMADAIKRIAPDEVKS